MLATLLLIQYFDLNFDSNSIPVPVTVNKFSYFVNRWSRAAPSQQKKFTKELHKDTSNYRKVYSTTGATKGLS